MIGSLNTEAQSYFSRARRHALLVLLLLGYGVMLLLNFQQDRTIAEQRELIHSLLRDSVELNAMKMQRAQAARLR